MGSRAIANELLLKLGFQVSARTVGKVHAANRAGTAARKAIKAIVTGERINAPGFAGVQIRSSSEIQIVDLPAGFFDAWKATMRVPPPK